MTRPLLRRLEQNRALRRTIARLEGIPRPERNRLRVLCYGEVEDRTAFERQLDHLRTRYRPMTLEELHGALGMWQPPPARATLLAFRTSARHFRERVLPPLEERGLPSLLLLKPEEFVRQSDTLEQLLSEGVRLGVDLDGESADGDELERRWQDSIATLDRHVHAAIRVLFRPCGWPESWIERMRRSGAELGIIDREGINDLRCSDRLHLRSIPLEATDSLDLFRSKLAACSARFGRLVAPRTASERRAEHATRGSRRRLRYVYRPLDAVLTGGMDEELELGPSLRTISRLRCPHFERLHELVGVATKIFPGLARKIRRSLLDAERLPWRAEELHYLGHGTAATVFRLDLPGQHPMVLKVFRWTAGRRPELIIQHARHDRARYERLRRWFGDIVIPGQFLLIEGPLQGVPVFAVLQDRLRRGQDLLAREDRDLTALLEEDQPLRTQFVSFAQRVLELEKRGLFPDLIGPGNLIAGEVRGRRGLWIVDYGLYDRSSNSPGYPKKPIEETVRRFTSLLAELGCSLPA